MKKISVILLAINLVACGGLPKLAYPTGENKVPINIHLQNDNPNISIKYVDAPDQ